MPRWRIVGIGQELVAPAAAGARPRSGAGAPRLGAAQQQSRSRSRSGAGAPRLASRSRSAAPPAEIRRAFSLAHSSGAFSSGISGDAARQNCAAIISGARIISAGGGQNRKRAQKAPRKDAENAAGKNPEGFRARYSLYLVLLYTPPSPKNRHLCNLTNDAPATVGHTWPQRAHIKARTISARRTWANARKKSGPARRARCRSAARRNRSGAPADHGRSSEPAEPAPAPADLGPESFRKQRPGRRYIHITRETRPRSGP